MIVADDERLRCVRALEPFEVQLDDSYADDLVVAPHRLRDVVARIERSGADAEEAAHIPLHRFDEVRPEPILLTDEAVGLIPVAGRHAAARRRDDVRDVRAGAAIEVFEVAIGARDVVRVGRDEHILDERMFAKQIR